MTDDEIVQFLRESDEYVVTTSEVADALDVFARTALRRLSELADEERIGRRMLNDRTTVWWAVDSAPDAAPATPLRRLVGGVDREAAAAARERSAAWRDSLDDELTPDGT